MKVVAVSGYFLYPHVGHIRLFRDAKALGDRLVVIVNNDQQQEMKYGRVITPLRDRLEVVAALGVVDEVFAAVDTDRTVCRSLIELQPDIFANGGDRFDANIPEKPICDEHGIELVFNVGGEKVESSSRILGELSEESATN